MARRILVTGGEGMLGSEFGRFAGHFRMEIAAPRRTMLDVCDKAALAKWVDWIEGGWIVHCAALVDVEACAKHPEQAYDIIVSGTRNVAALATAGGARVFYPQSFLIYDGATQPIPETTAPRPLSRYGELKHTAERILVDGLDEPLIVRMAGFFGGEAKDKNFVGRIIPQMFDAIGRGETSFEVGTRIWQPTWTRDLAFNALHLMSNGASGMYHMASHGQASFAELAAEIASILGWRDRLTVVAVEAEAMARAELGRRPGAAVLACDRLAAEQADFQRPWRESLRAYLQAPFFDRFRLEA